MALAAPGLADGEPFEFGAIPEEADAGRGDGFSLDFAEDLQGIVVQAVHLLGAGDLLFLHEDDGADEETAEEFVGRFGDAKEVGRFHGAVQEK